MAQGGGVSESKVPCLYEESSFITFLKSATWLYPISRFLGHAIQCECSILHNNALSRLNELSVTGAIKFSYNICCISLHMQIIAMR